MRYACVSEMNCASIKGGGNIRLTLFLYLFSQELQLRLLQQHFVEFLDVFLFHLMAYSWSPVWYVHTVHQGFPGCYSDSLLVQLSVMDLKYQCCFVSSQVYV